MPAAASESDEPPQRPIPSSTRGGGPSEPPPFAELHCRSNFTFLVGASQPEELVRRAAAKFYTALALTDECTLSGVVRAHLEARECGLHFIVGSEIHFTTANGSPFARLVLLAQDRRGYGNLSELITIARRRAEKGSYIAHVGDIEGKVSRAPHLAGMPGCIALLLPYRTGTLESIFAQCMWLKTWFPDRAWVAGPNAFEIDEDLHCWYIEEAAARAGLRIVATTDTLMHAKGRKRLQDVVTAIRLNKPVQDCGFSLRPNAEQYLRARNVLAEDFPHVWLRETVEVARRCTFSLEELRYEYPEEIVPPGETAASHLRKLTYAGAADRFPQDLPDKVRAQIEHELTIIGQLQYEAYFLTVEDVVRFARAEHPPPGAQIVPPTRPPATAWTSPRLTRRARAYCLLRVEVAAH